MWGQVPAAKPPPPPPRFKAVPTPLARGMRLMHLPQYNFPNKSGLVRRSRGARRRGWHGSKTATCAASAAAYRAKKQ